MRRFLAAAFVALIAASCGPAATTPSAGPSSSPASTGALGDGIPGGIAVRRGARDGPPGARLDAEHEPHGLLCRSGERLVRRCRGRPADPSVRDHHARGPDRGRPGGMRDQLPGRADVRCGGRCPGRLGDGDPPAHGAGDRGPCLVRHQASERSRRPDLRRLRLPERGAHAACRHQGRRRLGDVQDRDARHGRVRGALREAGRLRDHVHRLGGHRGEPARDRAPNLRLRELRLPGFLPGRPRLRQRLAGGEARPGPRIRRGDGSRLRARGRRSGRGGGPAGVPEPGRLRRQPEPARREPAVPRCRRLPARRERGGGPPDAGRWQGYSGFLFEQGLLAGRGREAAHARRPTTGRCSRTTSCP